MDLYKQEQDGQGMFDLIKLRGCFEVALHNAETGEELERVKVHNTVVTSGRSYVLSMIQSTNPATATFNSIAVGTSTTAPTTGDTLLGSEALRIAIASWVTTGLSQNPPSWQAQCTFATNQANTTLGEAGVFNQSGANVQTMLSHVTFSTINKTTSNTLAISYTISN